MTYKERMGKTQKKLSKYACNDSDSVRLKKEKPDIRTEFFRDIDRVLYSLSYTRYIDKTQVFTLVENDNISKRMTHVQMVSKIARTIGRALGLNEDLIEAASLGHDLGHTPFGHFGESILNKISLEYNEGYFNHNVQSVRTLMELENNGMGTNLSIQVLDAILCHNGEFVSEKYEPNKKNYEEFLREYNLCYSDKKIISSLRPMTLEGCVVRISDVIAYIGKDVEDAIRIGILKKTDLPDLVVRVLGDNNGDIVNTIILDVIKKSDNKPYISLSPSIFDAIVQLKCFNYENIYLKADKMIRDNEIEKSFYDLFKIYVNQISNKKIKEDIYMVFLNNMNKEYIENTTVYRKVIDYIAGMTDEYFLNQCKKYIIE